MDEQPDIVAFGSRWRRGGRRPRPGRAAIVVLGLLLASLGAVVYLALLVAHQDGTIKDLHAAARKAGHQARATTAEPAPPVVSGSPMFTLPDMAGGSFSVVAMAIRPRPGSPALISLFVYGRHAGPGERYGLLEDICGGQYVSASDLADGTADRQGDLTIVAPDLTVSPRDPGVWFLVYRLRDGAPLGGIQGPLIGNGGRTFRTAPQCLAHLARTPSPRGCSATAGSLPSEQVRIPAL